MWSLGIRILRQTAHKQSSEIFTSPRSALGRFRSFANRQPATGPGADVLTEAPFSWKVLMKQVLPYIQIGLNEDTVASASSDISARRLDMGNMDSAARSRNSSSPRHSRRISSLIAVSTGRQLSMALQNGPVQPGSSIRRRSNQMSSMSQRRARRIWCTRLLTALLGYFLAFTATNA